MASRWDTEVPQFEGSGDVLKRYVVSCCEEEFEMKNDKTTPINIVKGNIPADLDYWNKSKKVVQLEYTIEEVDYKSDPDKGELLNRWVVHVDVDDDNVKPHFGFTVDEKHRPKVTGHIFFKTGKPPFVRPPLSSKVKLHQVSFGGGKDKRGGPDNKGSIYYLHSGVWFELP